MLQNNLGHCYHNGYGIEQNFIEAIKWFTKAAEQGHTKAQQKFRYLLCLYSYTR